MFRADAQIVRLHYWTPVMQRALSLYNWTVLLLIQVHT